MAKTLKIIPLVKDTYLAVIKNSVGSKTWRNFYAKVNNQKTDIMKDGDLSCAYFVSSVLKLFNLIIEIHGTVDGTIRDLEKTGWRKIKDPKVGSVLVWEAKEGKNNENHKHIGFYLGDDVAISNSSKSGKIAEHHFTFGTKNSRPIRAIEAIYTHKKLN